MIRSTLSFPFRVNSRLLTTGLIALSTVTATVSARALADEKITNPIAVFSGLDKITGRITTFDVYIDETVQFGALQLTPRVCYTRPDTAAPKTDTFVEVDEITLDREDSRISPGGCSLTAPASMQ